jgi:hypothetical protein
MPPAPLTTPIRSGMASRSTGLDAGVLLPWKRVATQSIIGAFR